MFHAVFGRHYISSYRGLEFYGNGDVSKILTTFVFSLVPWLSTWHCPHVLLIAVLRCHCC